MVLISKRFKNEMDCTYIVRKMECTLVTTVFTKSVVKTHLGTIERIRVPPNTFRQPILRTL